MLQTPLDSAPPPPPPPPPQHTQCVTVLLCVADPIGQCSPQHTQCVTVLLCVADPIGQCSPQNTQRVTVLLCVADPTGQCSPQHTQCDAGDCPCGILSQHCPSADTTPPPEPTGDSEVEWAQLSRTKLCLLDVCWLRKHHVLSSKVTMERRLVGGRASRKAKNGRVGVKVLCGDVNLQGMKAYSFAVISPVPVHWLLGVVTDPLPTCHLLWPHPLGFRPFEIKP